MKFRKKPVVIEAITFDELVQHGRDNGGNIVEGMPWSFHYNGHPITHHNDECYLILTLEGTMHFTPQDMLITGVQGEVYPCKKDIFEATYEPVERRQQEPNECLAALVEWLPIAERQLASLPPMPESKSYQCAIARVERMRAAIANASLK